MNANEREFLDALAERVVGAVYEVANVLGAGFLEKVYERALTKELALRGIKVRPQVAFPVSYKGQSVGEYCADILVEERLVVELKCVDRFSNEHIAQCINYLKASGLHIALLVNFQNPKVEWKRIVHNFLIRVHSRPIKHAPGRPFRSTQCRSRALPEPRSFRR